MTFWTILAILGVASAALGEPLPLFFAIPLIFKMCATIEKTEDRIWLLEEKDDDSRP